MAAVLKTAVPERVSGVRIPLPPPNKLQYTSQSQRHSKARVVDVGPQKHDASRTQVDRITQIAVSIACFG